MRKRKDTCRITSLGGGFEGDMILSGTFEISTGSEGRGVAIFGPRQWPENTIPYDMSAITGRTHR